MSTKLKFSFGACELGSIVSVAQPANAKDIGKNNFKA